MPAILTTQKLSLPVYKMPDNLFGNFRNPHDARINAEDYTLSNPGIKLFLYSIDPQPDMSGKIRMSLAATFLGGNIVRG